MKDWSKDSIKETLKQISLGEVSVCLPTGKSINSNDLVYRMLQALYQRQTGDEQVSENTSHSNGMGFNYNDAPFCSSVAQSSQRYSSLTDKQTRAIARVILKYSGQLKEIACSKLT